MKQMLVTKNKGSLNHSKASNKGGLCHIHLLGKLKHSVMLMISRMIEPLLTMNLLGIKPA